ncbi:hypothetical protein NQ317_014163 [Molorchus minor]|uniref:Uncharacterized protein n=1 Tax=Molorchus minor TaxID=1323400 RepID=A0ABQ9JPJ5_9CUCU|nr:hypothetical protein NQ317_014163 [Molorchus minor]
MKIATIEMVFDTIERPKTTREIKGLFLWSRISYAPESYLNSAPLITAHKHNIIHPDDVRPNIFSAVYDKNQRRITIPAEYINDPDFVL